MGENAENGGISKGRAADDPQHERWIDCSDEHGHVKEISTEGGGWTERLRMPPYEVQFGTIDRAEEFFKPIQHMKQLFRVKAGMEGDDGDGALARRVGFDCRGCIVDCMLTGGCHFSRVAAHEYLKAFCLANPEVRSDICGNPGAEKCYLDCQFWEVIDCETVEVLASILPPIGSEWAEEDKIELVTFRERMSRPMRVHREEGDK